MPKITYLEKVYECEVGERLRDVLIRNGVSPHNSIAKVICCYGLGTCGTCAVQIEGEVHELTTRESLRLNFPPHKSSNGLRLACQVKVEQDLVVTKHQGFWGQRRVDTAHG